MASRSAVDSVGVTSAAAVRTSACNYHGYSLYNASGSAVVVKIYDNASAASGTLLDVVVVPAAGYANAYYSVEDCIGGVLAQNGVYFSPGATIEGAIRVA